MDDEEFGRAFLGLPRRLTKAEVCYVEEVARLLRPKDDPATHPAVDVLWEELYDSGLTAQMLGYDGDGH